MVTLADKLNAIAENEKTAAPKTETNNELKMNVVKVEKPETKPETKPEAHEATKTTENVNNGETTNPPTETGDKKESED